MVDGWVAAVGTLKAMLGGDNKFKVELLSPSGELLVAEILLKNEPEVDHDLRIAMINEQVEYAEVSPPPTPKPSAKPKPKSSASSSDAFYFNVKLLDATESVLWSFPSNS